VITVEGNAGYSMLEFWRRRIGVLDASAWTVRILCPDTANYYQTTVADCAADDVWEYAIRAIGESNTYNAVMNPSGEWVATGSPTWFNIQGVQFITQQFAVDKFWELDGLCFSYGRWRSTAEEGASQTNYGVREHVVVDDDLKSDSDCECRAETLLYQLKDPVKRLDVQIQGNSNVFIGDRLSITLPPSALSAVNFDVVSIDHSIPKVSADPNQACWLMSLSLLDSVDHRFLPPNSFSEVITHQFRRMSEVMRGIQSVCK
jgi:hypothetical protein